MCVCEREFTLPNGCRATAYSFILRESRERSDSMNSFTSSCSVSAYFVKICLRTFAYLLTSGDTHTERENQRNSEGHEYRGKGKIGDIHVVIG